MPVTSTPTARQFNFGAFLTPGMFWFLAACLAAGLFFYPGSNALLRAWQLPEYSHGPLIPVLSLLLFLRQLKEVPVTEGAIQDRWVGVSVILVSIALAVVGRLANIADIVAYAMIIWVWGILLISFGWRTGKHFWPPVLHLVYMLPLPDTLYYKMSTWLQFISSELGVWFLGLLSVPVFLEGNIIDLGVYRLHVAEACSGLRYLFPILSFSYIFAVLYKGPMWHKAVLLISAAPITVLMNSVRIAIAGYIVNSYGTEWVEGFTHFFEGWVIFVSCIAILFLLARVMLFFQRTDMGLVDALDLDTDGLGTQAARLSYIQPSRALITATLMLFAATAIWQAVPERGTTPIERDSFAVFPRQLGDWRQEGRPIVLEPRVAKALQADDYHSINLLQQDSPVPVGLFIAWYKDQSRGGVHSPEVCLPASGWEISWLERMDISEELPLTGFEAADQEFKINRAIIQKGEARMMVYYWFDQKGRKVAWDFAAKMYLIYDGVATGRTDGALVRLTTQILPSETDAQAEARLQSLLTELMDPLDRFVPQG